MNLSDRSDKMVAANSINPLVTVALERGASHDQQNPCTLCGRQACKLLTHKRFLDRLDREEAGSKKEGAARLMNTAFACSYAFNPLSAAIAYVNGQLESGLDCSALYEHADIVSALHKLIAYDIGRNTPFTDPTERPVGAVAADWLAATAVDEIACTSTLNLWVSIEWTNTKKPSLERYGAQLTSLFLNLLRNRVEGHEPITAGTIFAASNHLATCLIFHDQDRAQLDALMDGIEALINAVGGYKALTKNTHPGLIQSLLWNDVLYAWNTGAKPRFHLNYPPVMPPTLLPERVKAFSIPEFYNRCCGSDILEPAKHLKLFLMFRHGTECRALSESEYQYMILLERHVHVQLLEQQAHYHETDTASECIILAMGLMRMSVLCIWEQHWRVRRAHVRRLDRAVRAIPLKYWMERGAAKALIWICWVLLTQSQVNFDSGAVLDLVKDALISIFGKRAISRWPTVWHDGFAARLEPLLWHSDYDASVSKVSAMIMDHIRMK